MALSLVSVNIERSKHLDLVESFLEREKSDVVCVQELMQGDIPRLAAALGGAECLFEPATLRPEEGNGVLGVGIFTRVPVLTRCVRYYHGTPDILPESSQSDPATYNNMNRVVVSVDAEKDGGKFRIATTHFTWTPDGKPTDQQREHLRNLFGVLGGMREFVLTGDFNAPRGGEIFDALAERFKDNVPAVYTTSIDPKRHRAGALELMVDGLFSTAGYDIADVEMACGVSDHCALKASIERTV